MDDRQREVRVGEGLQESRLNTDFIQALEKYGPKALYVVLVIVLGYLGIQKYFEWREAQVDRAFREYEGSVATGSVDSLLAVARENEGKASVAALARLQAAKLLINAGWMEAPVGLSSAEAAAAETERLPDEQVRENYEQAAELLRRVLADVDGDKEIFIAQQARWDLATAQMSLGMFDEARASLEAFRDTAEASGLASHLEAAEQRLESMDRAQNPPALLARNDLPEASRRPEGEGVPGLNRPGQFPAGFPQIEGLPDGATVTPVPGSGPQPGQPQPGQPQPQPQPMGPQPMPTGPQSPGAPGGGG
jgi:hypothetical protein